VRGAISSDIAGQLSAPADALRTPLGDDLTNKHQTLPALALYESGRENHAALLYTTSLPENHCSAWAGAREYSGAAQRSMTASRIARHQHAASPHLLSGYHKTIPAINERR